VKRFTAAMWAFSACLAMAVLAANNRGNAYRIYLELEQSQFKADKQ
jgi:hypothetical protein